ncbi:MAG: nicotinate-nucleotide adenylyltransferase [Leptospirillia bacterium]
MNLDNARRVGVFGGTFNPIHACHLRVAEDCRVALGLDLILFVPAAEPPLKRVDVAPADKRLDMVRQAVEGHAGFAVSDIETCRDGPSYTIDTVRALKAEHPDVSWTLIMGLDAMLSIDAWHQADALLRACPVVVLFRPGAAFSQLRDLPALAGVDFTALDPCCGDAPDMPVHLSSADGIGLTLLKIQPCPTSGTRIRAAIRAGERRIDGLPETVERFIIQHHLYA